MCSHWPCWKTWGWQPELWATCFDAHESGPRAKGNTSDDSPGKPAAGVHTGHLQVAPVAQGTKMPYSAGQLAVFERELAQVFDNLRTLRARLIGETEQTLGSPRAREFLRHGVGRRLATLERCLENVFRLFPPSRQLPLARENLEDVKINTQAHVMNVIGVLDNWAHVFVAESGADVRAVGIDLFKAETRAILPAGLVAYLTTDAISNWHPTYAKDYRDSLAHRIPLYLPPSEMTAAEAARYRQLDQEILDCLVQGDIDDVDRLEDEKARIGHPSFQFIHALGEARPHLLHPQLVSDVMTMVELSERCRAERQR